MKKYKKLTVLLLVCVIGFSLVACSSELAMKADTAASSQEEVTAEDIPLESVGGDPMSLPPDIFVYELTAKNWNVEGITVKYPMFVGTNNQDKADILNELIMKDIEAVIDGITADSPDTKGVTIDAQYDYLELKNALLSICYYGTYFSEGGMYPVNFYHTLTLDMRKGERVSLSDVLTIDDQFVEIFKKGAYTPYSEDLDLEEAGLDVQAVIGEQYTNEALIQLFSDPRANYFLQEEAVLLSVPVPHALGDHLEMAIPYDGLQSHIKKEDTAANE